MSGENFQLERAERVRVYFELLAAVTIAKPGGCPPNKDGLSKSVGIGEGKVSREWCNAVWAQRLLEAGERLLDPVREQLRNEGRAYGQEPRTGATDAPF